MVSAEAIAKLPAVLKSVSGEQGANSAVALLLKPKRNDFDLLLVKRVENPSDPWSGQMALPGGKREPKDKDIKDTVMRETMEETGIKLDECRFLGVLTAISSKPKPEIKVLPFIVLLENEPKLKLNKEELESFILVPFEEIVQSKGTVKFSFGNVPAYIFADAIVWGVTYRIISKFIQAVEKASNI